MNRLPVIVTHIFLLLTLLIPSVCHAASPSDRDLQRFLNAYPVGELVAAGFRASVQLASSKSPAMQKKAACALKKFDKAVIEKAAFTEARTQFKDTSVLQTITMTLESTVGRKLVASLLRVGPGSSETPVFPNAGYTPSEEVELRRFQSTFEGAVFQNFSQTVGPKVEKNSEYLAMMNGIKATCMK